MCFGLIDIGQRGLKGNTAVSRKRRWKCLADHAYRILMGGHLSRDVGSVGSDRICYLTGQKH